MYGVKGPESREYKDFISNDASTLASPPGQVDEGSIVHELMKRDAEKINFEDFMEWSGSEKLEPKPEVFTDPFGTKLDYQFATEWPRQQ